MVGVGGGGRDWRSGDGIYHVFCVFGVESYFAGAVAFDGLFD